MNTFSNYPSYLSKTTSVLFGAVMAFVLTLSAVAAPAVRIESTMGVANVTAGDTSYAPSVTAGYDEVVKVQLWYHNMERDDSGLVADDLTAKFDIPTGQGSNQTIKGTVSGSNTNTVVSTANVNLGRDDAYLEYIPGTAKFRHNTGTNENVTYRTDDISDAVVTSGAGLRLEDAQPCFNFEASVTILLRVRVPSVSIEKSVSTPGNSDGWKDHITVAPGDKVKFLFSVLNDGNSELSNVTVGDVFPEGINYVNGTTVVTNGNHPNGIAISTDDIANGGLNLNKFAIGGYSYVTFEAIVAPASELDCGLNTLVNKAVANSDKAVIRTDTATVKTNVTCDQETFNYDCELLATVVGTDTRKVTANAEITKSDNVTLSGVSIDFGDGTVVNNNDAMHTYASEGNYKIVATATFNVDNEVKSATCEDSVNFTNEIEKCELPGKTHLAKDDPNCKETVTPTELPNTGSGSAIVAIFGAITASAAGYGFVQNRRLV